MNRTMKLARTRISATRSTHLHADRYMEIMHEKAEEMQEGREDVEVDYAV